MAHLPLTNSTPPAHARAAYGRAPGYHAGVLNTAVTYIADDLGTDNEAVLSSAVVLGAALGAICAGKLADLLGPKAAQLLNALPFALGTLLSAVAGHEATFLAGRLLTGFGAWGAAAA